MNIIPTGTWIYFEILKVSMVGGIVIPMSKQPEKEEVKVLAIGSKVKHTKIGDHIIGGANNMVAYKEADKEDSIGGFIKEEDIIAYVKDEVVAGK